MKLHEQHLISLTELCRTHHVDKLYLFGSNLSDCLNGNCDIYLLIQFEKIDFMHYFDNYMDLKENLEILFHHQVDLVEYQSIWNPVFRNAVDREKSIIYDRMSA